MATSIGSIAKRGSSSFNDDMLGYVFAISDFKEIAESVDSSIMNTSAPLMAIWHAMPYPSVLNP